MPNIMRMLFPFLAHVVTKSPRIYKYANHPEKAPIEIRYNYCQEAALSLQKGFRIKYVLKGKENLPDERVIFCPNHQSDWDCVTMLMVNDKPAGMLAKLDVSTMPVIDGVLRAIGGDYISRGFPLAELRTINKVGKKLVDNPNMSYFIFPEGTRTPDVIHRTVMEFHAGAFRVAQTTKAPIVPVALYGTYAVLEFGSKDKKVYPIQVSFLKPIYYEEYKNLKPQEIANLVHERVSDEVENLRKQQPILEEYWNRPENVKIYRAELKQEQKEYKKKRKLERKVEKKREKEWRLTHPLLPKNKKPKVSKEEKAKIQQMRAERNGLVEYYKKLGEQEKNESGDKQ